MREWRDEPCCIPQGLTLQAVMRNAVLAVCLLLPSSVLWAVIQLAAVFRKQAALQPCSLQALTICQVRATWLGLRNS